MRDRCDTKGREWKQAQKVERWAPRRLPRRERRFMTAAARKRPTVMPTATVTRPAAASIAVPNAFELVVAESVAKRRRPPLARPAGAQRECERRRRAVARGRRAYLMAAGRRCCTRERKGQVSAQPQGWAQGNLERGAPDNTDEHCALPREPAPRVAEEADRERPDKGRERRHILELPA